MNTTTIRRSCSGSLATRFLNRLRFETRASLGAKLRRCGGSASNSRLEKAILLLALILIILAITTFAVQAQIDGYVLQITTELDAQGHCQNWITLDNTIVTVEMEGAAPKLYPAAELPSHDPRENDDKQEWYIYAPGTDVCYLISFSAEAVALQVPQAQKSLCYWFRYSKDGDVFSEVSSVIIEGPERPKRPIKK